VFYRLFLWGATRFGKLAPKNVGPWTENHSAPVPARRSLHDLAKAHLNQGDR
jgi:L-lactate dehydrogenase complex protein LldF